MSEALSVLYDALNEQHWGGRLPALREPPDGVVLGRVAWQTLNAPEDSDRTAGLFLPPDRACPRPRIFVLQGLSARDERLVLLHELVHFWTWLVTGGQEKASAHGPVFMAELERIGRLEPRTREEVRRRRNRENVWDLLDAALK